MTSSDSSSYDPVHFNFEENPVSRSQRLPDDRDSHDPPETPSKADSQGGPFLRTEPSPELTTYTYYCDPPPPQFECHHALERRVFEIVGPDGRKSVFHDREVRFLVVEPDPETGELRPATRRGKPEILYLCREAGL